MDAQQQIRYEVQPYSYGDNDQPYYRVFDTKLGEWRGVCYLSKERAQARAVRANREAARK